MFTGSPLDVIMLSMMLGQNPEAGKLLDQAGIPVPSLGAPGGMGPDGNPMPAGPGAGMPGMGGLGQALTGLGGVKMPQAPQPIMTGGVTGGVRPPEMTAKMGSGAPSIESLMMAMGIGGKPQDPLRVPALGSMLRGGKY